MAKLKEHVGDGRLSALALSEDGAVADKYLRPFDLVEDRRSDIRSAEHALRIAVAYWLDLDCGVAAVHIRYQTQCFLDQGVIGAMGMIGSAQVEDETLIVCHCLPL